MTEEIPKTYQPQPIEEKWYKYWMENNFFHSEPDEREPYTIVIPPPNVTGVLHMGHMLNNTIQDVLVRRARMQGKNACWVPGTDHASIATETKVVHMLRERGIKKSDLKREEFLKYAWEWKEKYGGIILEQLKKLGASCDWQRTRFTMEPKMSEGVINVFIDLYEKGMIYRGLRMVNWDPQGRTALSDEEVIYKESNTKLYFIKYFLSEENHKPQTTNSKPFITIATTRPETILADVAICVNPKDERFKHLIGKKALVPFINRVIPIISDEYVDMEFGTGCLKVTPAHDLNDYEIGKKFNLEVIDILNEDGFLNEKAGDTRYIGKDRFAVRKQIVIDLDEAGHIEKIDDYKTQVGTSERTGAVIEKRLSMQWFVNMKKFIEKNPQVLSDVMNDEIKFHPAKMKNLYRHWITEIKDWCISRQLWWGQRIPAWYDEKGNFVVAKTEEEAIEKFKVQNLKFKIGDLRQDEDIVDTWFSSWLWPISVFDGFTDKNNKNLNYYYPTNDLVTAPEIIFFWVARMIIAGHEWMDKKPFSNVYFTGIVRDKQHRKMSKSLGNSPDPLDLISKFGADGVRMGMLLCSPAGNDILYDDSQIEQGRNFANKIWNAFRLVKSWEVKPDENFKKEILESNIISAQWFEFRFNEVLKEIEKDFTDYRLNEALMSIYKLIWDDFCSWYLEMIKAPSNSPEGGEWQTPQIDETTYKKTISIFEKLMKVLHPFMPFITEEIWQTLNERNTRESICVEKILQPKNSETIDLSRAFETISKIRELRNSKGISPKEKFEIAIKTSDENAYNPFLYLIKKLANVSEVKFVDEKQNNAQAISVFTDEIYVFLDLKIDAETEKVKIKKEIEYLKGFLKSVDAKLGNEKFVANAKSDLVEKERQKKADAEMKIETLTKNFQSL